MKHWMNYQKGRHLYIPWLSLWLLLAGMHMAVYTILDRYVYLQYSMLFYGIAAFVLLFIAILPRMGMLASLFCLGAVGFFYCRRDWDRLLSDLQVVFYYINQRSEEYIGQGIVNNGWCQSGSMEGNRIVVLFCLLSALFIALAFYRYFNRFYGVLPLFLIYCISLMLGRTPGQAATALLLAGMTVSFVWMAERQGALRQGQQESHMAADTWKRYFFALLIIILGLVGGWYGTERYQKAIFRNAEEVQKKQHQMELSAQKKAGEAVQYLRGVAGIDGGGQLSNSSPHYTNRVVLTVTLDEKPERSVYLRGFVGDIYYSNKWNVSNHMEKQDGKNQATERGTWQGEGLTDYDIYGENPSCGVTLQYERMGKYLYQPYSLQEADVSQEEKSICKGRQDDNLPMYEQLAGRMGEEGINLDEESVSDIISNVQWTLWSNAVYSTSLEPLPYNRNYAEYFLFISGKGYCEHFATAGTLLLRHLDVPARYATGYRVNADRFRKNSDGSYTAKVLDADAHAWSEVLSSEDVWLPQEMTPGDDADGMGSGSDIYQDSVSDTTLYRTDWEGDTTGQDRQLPEHPDAPEEDKKEKESEQQETAEVSPAESSGPQGTSGLGSGGGKGSAAASRGLQTALQTGIIAAFSCILAFFVWMMIRKIHRRRKELRLMEIRRLDPRKYVGLRTGLLFKRLKRAGVSVSARMPERQWIQVLQERFVEQEQFTEEEQSALLDLVRRAAFSREKVEEEEIQWLDGLCCRLEQAVLTR